MVESESQIPASSFGAMPVLQPLQNQTPQQVPEQLQTSSRVIIPSVKGVVDKEEVLKLVKKNVPVDAPVVRMISSN
jgi:hypothetical protein